MKFLPLGGTDVGASCYLYDFEDTRLLIDCGVQPGLLGQASLQTRAAGRPQTRRSDCHPCP